MKVILLTIVFYQLLMINNCLCNDKKATVLIVTLIRNKVHTLPYFFKYLDKLEYPKDRISLWINSDHNEDDSIKLIKHWINKYSSLYHDVYTNLEQYPTRRKNETSKNHWPEERFYDLIQMKQTALDYGRKIWADYIFFLDADVFLTFPNTLSKLIDFNLPIVAPMLTSESLYSNFWCGISDEYYYQRTAEYKEILEYDKRGNFNVPMVHSAVLINLNHYRSDLLTFDKSILNNILSNPNYKTKNTAYNGPIDDIIIFAMSANYSDIPMYISNEVTYGYILIPLDQDDDVIKDLQQLTNIKSLIINYCDDDGIKVDNVFNDYVFYPERDKLGLTDIYMINLVRRPERREKMDYLFKILGIDYTYMPAIDGKELNDDVLKDIGVRLLPGYTDPYHKRPLTMGEIGCFLSHYYIWVKMVELKQQEVLVLEDDIRFEPYFKERANSLIQEARRLGGWDLIYFGRKRLEESSYEPWVDGSEYMAHAGYSYWTLGYLLTLNGAKKLLSTNPLQNLIPVDEYLPVMFDKHPNKTLKQAFNKRDLIAYSAAPLLLYPVHYTGEDGYISDTEDSEHIDLNNFNNEDVQKKGDKENNDNNENYNFESHDDMLDDKRINVKIKTNLNLVNTINGDDFHKLSETRNEL